MTDATQTIFHFDKQQELLLEDYITSASNQFAVKLIQSWPHWKGQVALIYGPPKSGKSHLAHLWLHQAQGAKLRQEELAALSASEILAQQQHLLLENIENLEDETVLFHLINAVRTTENTSLLLTSTHAPAALDITLADVRSRLIACEQAELHLPDDALLKQLFAKYFSDHQLRITSEVIDYLTSRSERSFQAAAAIVEQLDALALTHKRNITIPFIKEMAPKLGLEV